MNYLAMSYDHRIIDGREAVLSLVAMKAGVWRIRRVAAGFVMLVTQVVVRC